MSVTIEQVKTVKKELDDITSELETLNNRYSDTLDKILNKSGCGEEFVKDNTDLERTPTRTPTSPESTSSCRNLIDKSKSLLLYINKKEIQKKRILKKLATYISLIKIQNRARSAASTARSITSKTRSPSSSSGKTKRSFFSLFSSKKD